MPGTTKAVDKNVVQKTFDGAANIAGKTEGLQKGVKLGMSILDFPLLFVSHAPLTALHGRLKSFKEVVASLHFVNRGREWFVGDPKKGGRTVMGDAAKKDGWKFASRFFLTIAHVMELFKFLHAVKVCVLDKVMSTTIGNLPIFGLVQKGSVLIHAFCGVVSDALGISGLNKRLNGSDGTKGTRSKLHKWESLGKKLQEEGQRVKDKLKAKYLKKIKKAEAAKPAGEAAQKKNVQSIKKLRRYLASVDDKAKTDLVKKYEDKISVAEKKGKTADVAARIEKLKKKLGSAKNISVKTLTDFQVSKWKTKTDNLLKTRTVKAISIAGHVAKVVLMSLWIIGVGVAGLGVFSVFGFGFAFASAGLVANSLGITKFLLSESGFKKIPDYKAYAPAA